MMRACRFGLCPWCCYPTTKVTFRNMNGL